MNMKKLYILCAALGATLMLGSCDDFLNTMPDNRAELDTEAKVASMLVSAYPNKVPILMMEYGTDNVMDHGPQYAVNYKDQEEIYLWQDITLDDNDDPRYMWQAHYSAIASANQALQAIDDLGNPASLAPQKAEALLCRAYAHFVLSTIFCLPYNPETADKDMGIPYSDKPETQVIVKYERGTMSQLYERINADIEAALPYIADEVYSVPKYHFNKKAAYAFATRFNLYYVQPDKSNLQKVVEYASQVLGSDPAGQLRQMINYLSFGADDLTNAYVQASETCNLLIQPAFAKSGRIGSGSGPRYNHGREITTNETYWALGPWGSSGSSTFLILGSRLFGSNQTVRYPKLDEFWEYTDKTGGSGYAHVVFVPFTTEETLLCRAEAYALLGKYDEAVADMNYWQKANCRSSYMDKEGVTHVLQPLTRESINSFWEGIKYCPVPLVAENGTDRTIKKTLHPQGFTVSAGEQENFVQCVLHLRRIQTMHEGLRWNDIKRYGIEVTHNRYGLSPDVLTVNDPRRALQLPSDVIDAGLTANPR